MPDADVLEQGSTDAEQLRRRVAQLSMVREISEALQSATELHEILRRVLVGATAGQGLRFNRAFLLLVDEARSELRGELATGPSSAEEASRIWSELQKKNPSLRHLLRRHQPVLESDGVRVNEIVHELVAPLAERDHFLVRALASPSTVHVRDGVEEGTDRAVDTELLERLGVRTFVAVPLQSEKEPVGLLLADNAITGRDIEDQDVEDLELLGIQAALAIERARLTDELARQVAALERATRELQENQQKLIRSDRLTTIGHMAARVAHEIRNPLVAIGGFARSLLRGAPPDDPRRESLQIIVDEVRRLERIVREVLDFTKPSAMHAEPIDLARLVAELFDLWRLECGEAGVEVAIDAPPDLPLVPGDRDRLYQALVNVARNAIHAMPDGGRLTARLRHDDAAVEVALQDTGTGMPPEVVSRLFEPFFTTKSAGSGLGLTIASQVVRDHGGDIDVSSCVGEGTTITIRLPRTEQGRE